MVLTQRRRDAETQRVWDRRRSFVLFPVRDHVPAVILFVFDGAPLRGINGSVVSSKLLPAVSVYLPAALLADGLQSIDQPGIGIKVAAWFHVFTGQASLASDPSLESQGLTAAIDAFVNAFHGRRGGVMV